MIIGYRLDDYVEYGLKVPVRVELAYKTSSLLVCGKSGSGKSLSVRYYCWNALKLGESRVYIADYKAGIEYEAFQGSKNYASGEEAIEMILNFYEFFQTVRKHRIRLKYHVMLVIEEWYGLLTYAETQSKKLKTELMAKIGEMLSVSRGLNIGIMLCIQRIDSSNFSSGSREQFQGMISFGRCSAEQFRMLGFNGELEENPTSNFKAGQALALIDGQDGVQEIIVPWIKNESEMCRGIKHYLDRQPDILSLIRTIAEGERTEQEKEGQDFSAG